METTDENLTEEEKKAVMEYMKEEVTKHQMKETQKAKKNRKDFVVTDEHRKQMAAKRDAARDAAAKSKREALINEKTKEALKTMKISVSETPVPSPAPTSSSVAPPTSASTATPDTAGEVKKGKKKSSVKSSKESKSKSKSKSKKSRPVESEEEESSDEGSDDESESESGDDSSGGEDSGSEVYDDVEPERPQKSSRKRKSTPKRYVKKVIIYKNGRQSRGEGNYPLSYDYDPYSGYPNPPPTVSYPGRSSTHIRQAPPSQSQRSHPPPQPHHLQSLSAPPPPQNRLVFMD